MPAVVAAKSDFVPAGRGAGRFVELSDRALITQMEQSGLRGMRTNPSSFKAAPPARGEEGAPGLLEVLGAL